jgi:hypothetical protein
MQFVGDIDMAAISFKIMKDVSNLKHDEDAVADFNMWSTKLITMTFNFGNYFLTCIVLFLFMSRLHIKRFVFSIIS